MCVDQQSYSIVTVPVASVLPLRARILLDGDENASRFPCDDHDATLHLAARTSDGIVAVATICRQPFRDFPADGAWRLRGVAVEPFMQGQGVGTRLMHACIEHAQRQNGKVVWCTARDSARGFYESLGFATFGVPLTIAARADMVFHEMHRLLPDNA
ncbi:MULTISPECIES: GNAT family N-acetyltransferase [Burkholderia]|uniref:GNAT family N-acetyltransferase n=1 Tax=Burkholderia TaxID=32008 RepID=UPI00032808D8|nr:MULTISPECIES: GNAT family N-acetyltransferase [Burkholderia]AGK51061.1 acetyltransferase domain protein [Burkholderia thailandensis MSMB121]ATF32043.1 N-acetyltransferase [Burkholderia thailandensis]KST72114.1 acetyltransferase [Burkholderia humptydooensis]KVN10099.1 acetyltransferase [Burkholderia sp. MSMB1552]KWZ50233.1 acetyltransferase [Burkholderia sp. MSMB1588]